MVLSQILINTPAFAETTSATESTAQNTSVATPNVASSSQMSSQSSSVASVQESKAPQSSASEQPQTTNNQSSSKAESAAPVSAEKATAASLKLTNATDFHGVITIKNHQGTKILDNATGQYTRTLDFKTAWRVSKKAVDSTGETWYQVANNQYVKGTDSYLSGATFFVSGSAYDGVATVKNTKGTVVTNSLDQTAQTLKYQTAWHISYKMIDVFGDVWYRVSTDGYVKAEDVTMAQNVFTGGKTIPKTVIYIKNTKGSMIINSDGQKGRVLPYQSAWRTSYVVYDASGVAWYQVAGGQFISSKDVYVEGTTYFTSEQPLRGVATVNKVGGSELINSHKAALRKLNNGSAWKVSAIAVDIFGDQWYKVGNENYLKASEVKFKKADVLTDTKTISNQVIQVKNHNGARIMNTDGTFGRTLGFKSGWRTHQTAKDSSGAIWYQVADKQYIAKKDVYSVGDPLIVSSADYRAIGTVINTKGTDLIDVNGKSSRNLANLTRWSISKKAQDIFGDYWYQVADKQYIAAADVLIEGENIFSKTEPMNDSVVIINKSGAETINSRGQKVKKLAVNSEWHVSQKLTDKTGTVWYAVGGNEFVKASDTAQRAFHVEQRYIAGLPHNETSGQFIVAHESGSVGSETDPDALEHAITYMQNNWTSAYVTHWVGDGGRIVQTAPVGEMSWGCGPTGNSKAFAQVELARTNNKAKFQKDYKAYIWLLRLLADEAGVSKQLDASGNGVKTHKWISYAYREVDHVDPYGYLAQMGVSRAQFVHDIQYGVQ